MASLNLTNAGHWRASSADCGPWVLTGAGLMGMLTPGLRGAVYAAGSDAPEKKEVKIGSIKIGGRKSDSHN